MSSTVTLFGLEFEYDFLSAWIKYNRLKKGLSQSALAYGICSVSHLSYFENGKSKLRKEVIELLLEKLNFTISIKKSIHIRKKLYDLLTHIESYNYIEAKIIYEELTKYKDLINSSPYSIEFKIYQLVYNSLVLQYDFNELRNEISLLDEIYTSLNKDLQHIYMFITGRIIYKNISPKQGIERLEKAYQCKETSWVNHSLGLSYHYNNQPLIAVQYIEKALEGYEKNGRYINAIWCHNHLGNAYTSLKQFEKAEDHFKAALNSAKYFEIASIFDVIYNNLAQLYFFVDRYNDSLYYSKLSLELSDDPLLTVYNLVNTYKKIDNLDKCKELFDLYLTDKYEDSRYYNLLYFSYLCIYHINEDFYYKEITEKILPYYNDLGFYSFCKTIKYKLAEHLELKRKYKDASKIYKELIDKHTILTI